MTITDTDLIAIDPADQPITCRCDLNCATGFKLSVNGRRALELSAAPALLLIHIFHNESSNVGPSDRRLMM